MPFIVLVQPRYANLQYIHYVFIEGHGLLNISAIGYEPVDLQSLEFVFGYQVDLQQKPETGVDWGGSEDLRCMLLGQ